LHSVYYKNKGYIGRKKYKLRPQQVKRPDLDEATSVGLMMIIHGRANKKGKKKIKLLCTRDMRYGGERE